MSVLSPCLRLFVMLAILFAGASGQEFQKEWNPFPVWMDGDTVAVPFWGGINNPKPSLRDVDGDGLIDLLIGQNTRLGMFQNQGTASAPVWVPVTEKLAGINIGTWHQMEDIDADGDLDLFCDARNGKAAFYENLTGGLMPDFTLVDTAFGGFTTGVNNTPTFTDIDADNDLDFFYGGTSGYLVYYENIGDSANPSYEFITDAYDSILAFPSSPVSQPGPGLSENRHGFSAITFADTDDDNDYDLYWGDINNLSMYLFANNGGPTESDLVQVTESYLPGFTQGFNHSTWRDIDADTDLDLIVGVQGELNNLLLYENIGTPQSANISIVDSMVIDVLDLGSIAKPAFGDLDADGDIDMLLGGSPSGLWYFENTGDAINPEFTLMSTSYKSIDAGSFLSPALVDWDSDGDLDLLVGNLFGRIEYWRNEGDSANFNPVRLSTQLAGIKVDQLVTPAPADMDGDGLIDLVVGEWDFNGFANILIYENVGTAGNPSLSLKTSGTIPREFREYTSPTPYDWDRDGRLDLIVGTRNEGLTWYRNVTDSGFPDSLTLVAQPDTLPGATDGTLLLWRAVDIDADGDDDVFTGEEAGGVNFHRSSGCCVGIRGNADNDAQQIVDVGDITVLVDYLFLSGPPPVCSPEANADGGANGVVDIGDITVLVDYLFLGGSLPGPCP